MSWYPTNVFGAALTSDGAAIHHLARETLG